MSRSDKTPSFTRYTSYSKSPQTIIRTITGYLEQVQPETSTTVKIQINGPTATGFIFLTPVPTNATYRVVEVTTAHETNETFEASHTHDPEPIGPALEMVNTYLKQFWGRFNGTHIDIQQRDLQTLRSPLKDTLEKQNP